MRVAGFSPAWRGVGYWNFGKYAFVASEGGAIRIGGCAPRALALAGSSRNAKA